MNIEQSGDARKTMDVVDIDDDYHVRQWTEILDITSQELTAAVQAVGTSAVRVRQYVRQRKNGKPSDR